jgi:hypothetical protein
VRKDLETELRVLVQHLETARGVVGAMGAHEILLVEQALKVLSHLLAAARPGIAL